MRYPRRCCHWRELHDYAKRHRWLILVGGGAPGKGTPVIGKNVFLGAGCVVIGDISIGDGSVIGANAVVTKSIPPNSVAVGVPARVIKTLTS